MPISLSEVDRKFVKRLAREENEILAELARTNLEQLRRQGSKAVDYEAIRIKAIRSLRRAVTTQRGRVLGASCRST